VSEAVHATAVLLGERGVLLRGPSGAGKSRLALALIEGFKRDGGFAALVADDRVWLDAINGRLVARGHPRLAGLCESRGEGLIEVPHEPRAVLRLLVDIGRAPRMPEAADRYDMICGIVLPRLRLDLSPGLAGAAAVTLAALRLVEGETWCVEGYTWRKIVYDDTNFA
jgi:HPr kinase/phosphorylase